MAETAYVALDGPPFSGKSTLAEHLHRRYGFEIIEEPNALLNIDGVTEWLRPPDSPARSRWQIDTYRERAITRATQTAAARAAGKSVVGEHTILLPLNVYQAFSDAGFELPVDMDYALETTKKAFDRGDVIVPDALVVMRAATEAEHNRRVAKRGQLPGADLLSAWGTAEIIAEASLSVARQVLPDSVEILFVPSDNDPDQAQAMAGLQPVFDRLSLGSQ